jgi:hypothetical protein
LSQDWWREALVKKEMFPWLWDMDVDIVYSKTGDWNWELLARKLSQVQIHEPTDTSLALPLALRNRRRIWRLLEEARVDDVAGPEGRARADREEEQKKRWAALSIGPVTSAPHGFPGSSFKRP